MLLFAFNTGYGRSLVCLHCKAAWVSRHSKKSFQSRDLCCVRQGKTIISYNTGLFVQTKHKPINFTSISSHEHWITLKNKDMNTNACVSETGRYLEQETRAYWHVQMEVVHVLRWSHKVLWLCIANVFSYILLFQI